MSDLFPCPVDICVLNNLIFTFNDNFVRVCSKTPQLKLISIRKFLVSGDEEREYQVVVCPNFIPQERRDNMKGKSKQKKEKKKEKKKPKKKK